MSKSMKFTISLPNKEFQEMEIFRKKKGVCRSKFVLEAIKLLKETIERECLVREYEEGYKRVPENLQDIEVWEKSSLNLFSSEGW